MPGSIPFLRGNTQATKTQDRNLSNRFGFEINGHLIGGVHSIGGIELETEIHEYRDGGMTKMQTRPGNHKPGTLVVTKDWSNTTEWYDWRKKVLDNMVERQPVSIIFHSDSGAEAGRLNLGEAWPKKHKFPEHNAKQSGHGVETLEICFETFEFKPA